MLRPAHAEISPHYFCKVNVGTEAKLSWLSRRTSHVGISADPQFVKQSHCQQLAGTWKVCCMAMKMGLCLPAGNAKIHCCPVVIAILFANPAHLQFQLRGLTVLGSIFFFISDLSLITLPCVLVFVFCLIWSKYRPNSSEELSKQHGSKDRWQRCGLPYHMTPEARWEALMGHNYVVIY